MAPWYRQDSFLTQPGDGTYDPVQPGNIGGVKPSPGTMAEPPANSARETFSTDETIEERNEKAVGSDSPNPVATDMKPDEQYSPGRDDDGEVEGEVGLYSPNDGADNLFSPGADEEAREK